MGVVVGGWVVKGGKGWVGGWVVGELGNGVLN